MEGLSFRSEEDGGFVIDVENNGGREEGKERRVELCLIGRFITHKAIRFSAMEDRMAMVWRPAKSVEVNEVGQGRYFFSSSSTAWI